MQMPIRIGRLYCNCDVTGDDDYDDGDGADDEDKQATVINDNEIQIWNNDVHTLVLTTLRTPYFGVLLLCMHVCIVVRS